MNLDHIDKQVTRRQAADNGTVGFFCRVDSSLLVAAMPLTFVVPTPLKLARPKKGLKKKKHEHSELTKNETKQQKEQELTQKTDREGGSCEMQGPWAMLGIYEAFSQRQWCFEHPLTRGNL